MLLLCVSSYHCCPLHSRPTWSIEESRKSYCNKGSGQKRLPNLPCQVHWRRDVNFFVQSLPYCIFFNNTNCMKQLLQTQGDGNEKDSAQSKYGHASPRYKKKKNRHQSAHGIFISICPSHKRINYCRSECKNCKRCQTNRTQAFRPRWFDMASEKAKLLCFFLQFLHRLVIRTT